MRPAVDVASLGGVPWLVGLTEEGGAFPYAFNSQNGRELAGATFSPDGRTLFVNIQVPGQTFAFWGPWEGAVG